MSLSKAGHTAINTALSIALVYCAWRAYEWKGLFWVIFAELFLIAIAFSKKVKP